MLYELMKAARQGARKPQLSFGRNMVGALKSLTIPF